MKGENIVYVVEHLSKTRGWIPVYGCLSTTRERGRKYYREFRIANPDVECRLSRYEPEYKR